MTKEEILAMNPSIQLGNLVAIEVMEWRREGDHWVTPEGFWVDAEGLHGWYPWRDISAAWQVVDKNDYSWFDVWRAYGKFYAKVRDGRLKGLEVVAGPCETAPVAISKVALLAIHSQKNV